MVRDLIDPATEMPTSFEELAARHGIELPGPGEDVGVAIAPAEMQPGDVVHAGDQTYIYAGEGIVMSPLTGETSDITDVGLFEGPNDGVFRLDPGDGTVAPGAGTTAMDTPADPATPPAADEPTPDSEPSTTVGGAPDAAPSDSSASPWEYSDTAPVGMGAGQNQPASDATDPASAPAGGPSETQFEGEALGGAPESLGPAEGEIDGEVGGSTAVGSGSSSSLLGGGLDPNSVTGQP